MAIDFLASLRASQAPVPVESGTDVAPAEIVQEAAPETPIAPVEVVPVVAEKPVPMVPSRVLAASNQRARTAEAEVVALKASHAELTSKFAALESRAQAAQPGTAAAVAPADATDEQWVDRLLNGREPEELTRKELDGIRKEMSEFKAWQQTQDARVQTQDAREQDAQLDSYLPALMADLPGVPEAAVLRHLAAKVSPEEIIEMYAQARPAPIAPAAPARPTATALPRVNAPATPAAATAEKRTFAQAIADMKAGR